MHDRFAHWAYRGKRPNWLASILNRGWAVVHGLGLLPDYLVTLEVRGRRSGRTISLPLVMAVCDGERYLVSMLGKGVSWVKNVEAADGEAVLHHGRRERVVLEEIPPEERPPVIRAYLRRAPGGRPHIPVRPDSPLEDIERIAADVPVFRVVAPTSR